MKATVLALCALFALACTAAAAPATPVFAHVYNASLTWKNTVSGEFLAFENAYDFGNQRYLVRYPDEGLTIIQRYDQGKEYIIKFFECTTRTLSGKLAELNVPSGAAYQGVDTINGKSVDHWQWQDSAFEKTDFWNTPGASNNVPVRELDSANVFSVQIDYVSFTPLSAIPESVFEPPSVVKARCQPGDAKTVMSAAEKAMRMTL
jgi:hypothetical protein